MEPYVAGVVTVIVMIGLFGIVTVSLAAWNRREARRKKTVGDGLDSAGTKELHSDRSGRWMAVGFIILSLAIGLLIGVYSSYLARFFSG